MRFRRCTLAASILALSASVAAGQPQGPARASAEDTAVVRVVTGAAIRELSGFVAGAIFDSVARPWTVIVPDSTSAAWQTARGGLLDLVRGRVPTSGDDQEFFVEFESVSVAGDRLRAAFTAGVQRRCGPVWHRAGTRVELVASRVAGSWQPAEVVQAIAFDPPPCAP